jgi:hypothetical protein
MMVKALKYFKDAGNFDPAIREWEARPIATQTYANLKTVMCTEFSRLNRQDATSARMAGHASANNIVEEMANATKELVAELTEKHAKQVEALIKANNDAMEKLTAAILSVNKPGATSGATTNSDAAAKRAAKAAAWKEKKEKATVCPHCDCKHPNRTHDQCWELPANAAKHPAGWKLVKST